MSLHLLIITEDVPPDTSVDSLVASLVPAELGILWWHIEAFDLMDAVTQVTALQSGRHPYQEVYENLYEQNRDRMLHPTRGEIYKAALLDGAQVYFYATHEGAITWTLSQAQTTGPSLLPSAGTLH